MKKDKQHEKTSYVKGIIVRCRTKCRTLILVWYLAEGELLSLSPHSNNASALCMGYSINQSVTFSFLFCFEHSQLIWGDLDNRKRRSRALAERKRNRFRVSFRLMIARRRSIFFFFRFGGSNKLELTFIDGGTRGCGPAS